MQPDHVTAIMITMRQLHSESQTTPGPDSLASLCRKASD